MASGRGVRASGSGARRLPCAVRPQQDLRLSVSRLRPDLRNDPYPRPCPARPGVSAGQGPRSEEHTSELQSLMRISYAVFCLKKKNSYLLNKHTCKIKNADIIALLTTIS